MPYLREIIVLLLVMCAAYVINRVLTIPPPIVWILNVIIAIALIVFVFNVTGLMGALR